MHVSHVLYGTTVALRFILEVILGIEAIMSMPIWDYIMFTQIQHT